MRVLFQGTVGGRPATVVASERADGSFHPGEVDPDDLHLRQRRLTGRRWAMVDEVHGTQVREAAAAEPASVVCGFGDVIVGSRGGPPVAIWAADCAPLMLLGGSSTVGIHAGWRGLAAGVVDVGVDALLGHGDAVEIAVLGPVIHPCCYEFGVGELEVVATGVGAQPAELAGTTRDGATALDVPAAVRAALARRGIALGAVGPCTGCGGSWFSHRTRADRGRHAVVAWIGEHPSTVGA
jgi:copper oxidase (laccase) domain-containing protein